MARRSAVVVYATYRYELRRGDEIVVTGYLTNDAPLEVGESITSAAVDRE